MKCKNVIVIVETIKKNKAVLLFIFRFHGVYEECSLMNEITFGSEGNDAMKNIEIIIRKLYKAKFWLKMKLINIPILAESCNALCEMQMN